MAVRSGISIERRGFNISDYDHKIFSVEFQQYDMSTMVIAKVRIYEKKEES